MLADLEDLNARWHSFGLLHFELIRLGLHNLEYHPCQNALVCANVERDDLGDSCSIAKILDDWRDVWQEYRDEGYAEIDGDDIRLTRAGLLRADGLLPAFFETEHQGVRYT